uniref:Uncharacterized protein n=1 Tax=Meloidogyne enterolobii TaxID=390850 RepID=A0A6V7UZC2_MELEN|nr:unnamed protein product [Meloidogyne enterolobii]
MLYSSRLFPIIMLIANIALLLPPSALSSSSSLFCPEMECPSQIFKEKEKKITSKFEQLSTSNNKNKKKKLENLFHFIALTQDCQLIISRPDQLSKLSSLKINHRFNECSSNKVKLVWHFASTTPSLLLFQKRSENELCVLPVETPNSLNIQGNELFCYSIRSSLIHHAKCSRLNGIKIEIEELFSDELYSDLFYLMEYSSSNNYLLHQLRLSLNDFLLSNDPQTKRLFIVPQKLNVNSMVEWTCPFDLLYRQGLYFCIIKQEKAEFKRFQILPNRRSSSSLQKQWKISGFSVDRNLIAFTVSNFSSSYYTKIPSTELFLAKIPSDNSKTVSIAETHCALNLMPFDINFMIISEKTLAELTTRGPLPQMDETLIEKVNRNKYRHATKLDERLNQRKQQKTTTKTFIAITKFLNKITTNPTIASTTFQTTIEKQSKTTTKTPNIEKQTPTNFGVKTTQQTSKQTTKPEQNKNIEIKTTKQTTTETPEQTQQTKTNFKSETENSGSSIHSIPIRVKPESIIEEEGEQLGDYIYVEDPLMEELPLDEENDLQNDEEEHNLVPLPGEEVEEENEEKEIQNQTESQSLNSAIFRKEIERWILIVFTLLIMLRY